MPCHSDRLLSLFCLVYLAFAKGNQAFHRACLKVCALTGNLRVRHAMPGDIHLSPTGCDEFNNAIRESEIPSNRGSQDVRICHTGFLTHDHPRASTSRSTSSPFLALLEPCDSEERTRSSEPSGRRSSCQGPGEAGDLRIHSAKGSCRNPPTLASLTISGRAFRRTLHPRFCHHVHRHSNVALETSLPPLPPRTYLDTLSHALSDNMFVARPA